MDEGDAGVHGDFGRRRLTEPIRYTIIFVIYAVKMLQRLRVSRDRKVVRCDVHDIEED